MDGCEEGRCCGWSARPQHAIRIGPRYPGSPQGYLGRQSRRRLIGTSKLALNRFQEAQPHPGKSELFCTPPWISNALRPSRIFPCLGLVPGRSVILGGSVFFLVTLG